MKRPLPRGHGSVVSVRYRAVTAKERSLNHKLSQQRLELVMDVGKLCGIRRNACPTNSTPGLVKVRELSVGQASEVFIPETAPLKNAPDKVT